MFLLKNEQKLFCHSVFIDNFIQNNNYANINFESLVILKKSMKMIKNILIIMAALCLFQNISAAIENTPEQINSIQTRIDSIGFDILNRNKIPQRIVFVYDEQDKKNILTSDKTLTKRQVVIYDEMYKSAESDDELAAMIAREISFAIRSFDGVCNGFLRSIQVKAAPKKFEIVADKRAVDFMVNAGYDPVALIIYIQKTAPQQRFDMISNHNLTSKRLAVIYEYIYTKYPYFLKNNKYIDNKYYQNFLLTSASNRKMLEEKIRTNSNEKLKYE